MPCPARSLARSPSLIHAIHAAAALFISVGLYDLIRDDLHHEPDLSVLVHMDAPVSIPTSNFPTNNSLIGQL